MFIPAKLTVSLNHTCTKTRSDLVPLHLGQKRINLAERLGRLAANVGGAIVWNLPR